MKKGCVIIMPLDHQHQMTILKDILSNHKEDGLGTVSECEQVERLAKSLIANESITNELKNTLTDVYSYSQQGKSATDLDAHVNSHEEQLSQWVEDFNTYS